MKAVVFGAISICALSALAQNTVVIIPAFENRFGGPHQTVITVRNNEGTRSTSGLIPSRRQGTAAGTVTTDGSRQVQALDARTMNIPVFPGTTSFGTTADGTTVTIVPEASGSALITNVFGQVIGVGGSSVTLPPRTTGAWPAVNAVPAPAAPAPTGGGFEESLGRPPGSIPPSIVPGSGVSPEGRSGQPVPPPPGTTPASRGVQEATPAPASPRPTSP